ncbi:Uu.00g039580.m01.CDS01 [Anthostomella pinea]|uniref:Uu.00g039580.m01.CDS01 n=1 Tax=Anthostomella pinea TaxID=933095 RepID=A0AAI8YDU6_9PEZI|nr:Uu.00g039580.m01.CDS01 [Anthostomella pinea]
MSVGFGFSVDDFLAALNLVGTVIDCLRESSASGAAYRELIQELYTLESALLRVKRLDLDAGQRAEKVALRQAATQCQRTIDDFWKTAIVRYYPHLREGGSGSRLKDGWAKIRWTFLKADNVEKFKSDIRAHTGSIEVLLLTVQLEATSMAAREQGRQHSVKQGKELLESTANIVQGNLRVFQMVFDIHQFILSLPAQVHRQQAVYMIDAFG